MIDITDLLLYSNVSSLKLIEKVTGTISSPTFSDTGYHSNTATISHGLDTDEIICIAVADTGGTLYTYRIVAPYVTGNGSDGIDISWDSNNVYFSAYGGNFGSGGHTGITYNYTIFICVP